MARFTDKQKVFIDKYFECKFNATEAARQAGYKGNYATLRSIGSENLTKPNIKEEIALRMSDYAMSANEALAELAEIARLDISDYLEFKPGIREPYLDLAKAKEAGLMRFVKKIKYNAQGMLEFELYDKQAALVQIGKWQGLSEKIDHSGTVQHEHGLTIKDWQEQSKDRLNDVAKTLASFESVDDA